MEHDQTVLPDDATGAFEQALDMVRDLRKRYDELLSECAKLKEKLCRSSSSLPLTTNTEL